MKKIKRKKAFIGAAISAVGAIAGLAGNLIMQKKNAKAQAEQLAAEQAFAAEQAELDRQAQREQFEAEQNYLKEQRRLEQEAADKQWQQAQTQANKQSALSQAQALTEEAQNQEYVNVMKSRVSMKVGGKYKDRNNNKKTKVKKKAGFGTEMMNSWNSQSSLAKAGDIMGGIGGAIGGVGNLVMALTQKTPEVVKQTPIKPQVFQKEALAPVEQKQVIQGETFKAAKKKEIKLPNQRVQGNGLQNTATPLAMLGKSKRIKHKSINRFK